MNSKTKTTLGIMIFTIFIVITALICNNLSEPFKPQTPLSIVEAEATDISDEEDKLTAAPDFTALNNDSNIVAGSEEVMSEETLHKSISLIKDSDTQMNKAEYHKITADEAKQMLDNNPDSILLDVRTEEEFKAQRIDGAILIPDYEIEERAKAEFPDKDALILIYCRSGNRSKTAANILVSMGYTNIYDFGGITLYPYETISD